MAPVLKAAIYRCRTPDLEPLVDQGVSPEQGCGIKGFLPTSVIQGNPPVYQQNSRWEALSVVSQKWIPFPPALLLSVVRGGVPHHLLTPQVPGLDVCLFFEDHFAGTQRLQFD